MSLATEEDREKIDETEVDDLDSNHPRSTATSIDSCATADFETNNNKNHSLVYNMLFPWTLRKSSAALSLASASLLAASERRYRHRRDAQLEDSEEELMTFLAGSAALMWAAPLAQLAGVEKYGAAAFPLVQPFRGGAGFVVLQAFAWICYSVAAFGCLLALLNPTEAASLRGLKTVIGLLGAVGQALVSWSLEFFMSEGVSTQEERREEASILMPDSEDEANDCDNEFDEVKSRTGSQNSGSHSDEELVVSTRRARKVAMGRLVAVITTCVGTGVLFVTAFWDLTGGQGKKKLRALIASQDTIVATSTIALCVEMFFIHGLSFYFTTFSRKGLALSSYRKMMVRAARFFSLCMFLCALWISYRLVVNPEFGQITGILTLLGVTGLLAQLLGAWTLVTMAWNTSASMTFGDREHPITELFTSPFHQYETSQTQEPPRSPASQASSTSGVGFSTKATTPSALTSSRYLLSILLFVSGLILRSNPVKIQFYLKSMTLEELPITFFSDDLPIACVLLGAPLAHLGASSVVPNYRPLQTLQGGLTFAIAHGVAWLMYALSIGAFVVVNVSDLTLEERSNRAVPIVYSAGLFAHLIVIASIPWFKQPKSTPKTRGQIGISDATTSYAAMPRAAGATTPIHKKITRGSTKFLRENIGVSLSMVTVFVSFLLEAADSDLIKSEYRNLIVWACMVCSLCAALAVSTYARPWTGGPSFVLEQSLGATVYACALLAQVILAWNTVPGSGFWFTLASMIQAVGVYILSAAKQVYLRDTVRPNNEADDNKKLPRTFSSILLAKEYADDALDLAAMEKILSSSRSSLRERPRVYSYMQGFAKMVAVERANKLRRRLISGIALVLAMHVSMILFALADKFRSPELLLGGVVLATVCAFTIRLVCGAWLYGESFFAAGFLNGGLVHIVLSLLGHVLLTSSILGTMTCYSYDLERIPLNGLVAGLGFAAYTGNMCLLLGLLGFDRDAPAMSTILDHIVGINGVALGFAAFVCFASVDIAMIRFGFLQNEQQHLVPVIVAAWAAAAASIPLAHITAVKRSTTVSFFHVAGLAMWSFALLLGLLLIGRAAEHATSTSVSALSSKTGFATLTANILVEPGARRGVAILGFEVVVGLVMFGFMYVFVPGLRLFLDGPMYYWSYFFKTWHHSRSPDGHQPMEGVMILRNVSYGQDVLDIMVPSGPVEETGADTRCVVYVHGGGHIFVRRELLTHSVSPFCRLGFVVLAVEYPLSPDVPFPTAVVCVIEAMKWAKEHLCRGGICVSGSRPPRRCEECGPAPDLVPGILGYQCRCCPHRKGMTSVQLLGDSAGGNLVSMATAILINPPLAKRIAPFSGFDDFLEWNLPKIERLAVLYGLLGRGDPALTSQVTTWWDYIFMKGGDATIDFVLKQYEGGKIGHDVLDGRLVLNDLDGDLLKDFAPETLLLCGRSDPLYEVNLRTIKLLRAATKRPVELIDYPGSFHGFHGLPPQWTFGRWRVDAFPATRELARFFTGGRVLLTEPKAQPLDYSPFLVLPACALGFGITGHMGWMVLNFFMEHITG